MLVFHPEQEIASASASPDRSRVSSAHDGYELESARLLQGRREVLIRHGGECYRLRHTRNGKLILTK